MNVDSIVRYLTEHHLTVATAESCTGGLLAARLIDVPGASDVFSEGYITYSNEAKQKRLSVSENTLREYGAVSSQCAEEMACGAARLSGSDFGLSTTGIAGPGGGTDEKPVGLVYIGLCHGEKTVTEEHFFSGSRRDVREQTVLHALTLLERELK